MIIGTPNAPEIVCDIATEPASVGDARTIVDWPAPIATKRIEPSFESTPLPPWAAYGAGYAAEADGTTASAPRTTRQRPSLRTITPPSTLTGVLRRSGQQRSLRPANLQEQEEERPGEADAEHEPEPGEAAAAPVRPANSRGRRSANCDRSASAPRAAGRATPGRRSGDRSDLPTPRGGRCSGRRRGRCRARARTDSHRGSGRACTPSGRRRTWFASSHIPASPSSSASGPRCAREAGGSSAGRTRARRNAGSRWSTAAE